MTTNASRRAFLQRTSLLSMAGVAAPWALNLAAMGEAAAATATDYKALVCVFLYGGNDYGNTLIPYDTARYTLYQGMRPTLAYAQSALAPTLLTPTVALPNGIQYALAPEGATSGWGGRMGDLFEAGNGNATFTCVNVSSNAVFLSGHTAVQYQVSPSGPVALNGVKSPLFGSANCSAALHTLVTAPRTHLFENEYTRVMSRSLFAGDALTTALAGGPVINTVFPTANALADQLKLVARMISTSLEVGAKRQVFFVSMGGFDTHDGLASIHPGLLTSVAGAMSAFYNATVELGVANQVTSFTASDFGRTLTANDGSDHGWGSMHFMLGGAVNGGRFYGTAPVVANDGADDVGQGRLLPSTSVDQYAATLGKWFGISNSDLLTVLPNLANWNASQRTLGFV